MKTKTSPAGNSDPAAERDPYRDPYPDLSAAEGSRRALAKAYRNWKPIEIEWKPNDFDRSMLLARLKWNLMNECPATIERMRSEGIPITVGYLGGALELAVGRTKPLSAIVPWNVPDPVLVRMIKQVADEWFNAVKGSR